MTEQDKLQEKYSYLQRMAEDECSKGITTGFEGCGAKYREFLQQSNEVKSQLDSVSELTKRLESKFLYETEGLTPLEILMKDREAISLVPQNYIKDFPKDLVRQEDYIDKQQDISLLYPYYLLTQSQGREDSAVLALALAVVVDGTSLLLSSAVDRPYRKRKRIESLADFIRSSLTDLASFATTVFHPLDKRSSFLSREEISALDITVQVAMSKMSPSDLEMLLLALRKATSSFPPHRLNWQSLVSVGSPMHNDFYRELLEKMKVMGIVETAHTPDKNGTEIIFVAHRYQSFLRWTDEQLLLIHEEMQSGIPKNDNPSSNQKTRREGWGSVFDTYKDENNDN